MVVYKTALFKYNGNNINKYSQNMYYVYHKYRFMQLLYNIKYINKDIK